MKEETFINDKSGNLLEVLNSETLDKLLQQCLDEYFPELKEQDIGIGYVLNTNNQGGAKAGRWIILFLSDALPKDHIGLKFIVVHELCHFINLHNPNEVFKKKVPKKIYQIWKQLEKKGEVKCSHGNAT